MAEDLNTSQYKVKVVPILVEGITVTGTAEATTVGIGQTLQMSAAITPENTTDKTVSWNVVDGTGHATIDNNGLLTGETEGIVTVIATANDGSDVKGSLEITVVISVTGVSLNKSVMFLQEGTMAEESLIAIVEPADATNTEVTWESDNLDVATVDNNGKVTAIALGTAKITATTVDREKTATCEVTVVGSDPIIDDSCVLYLDGRYGTNDPATQTWYDLSGKGNHGTLKNFDYAEGSGWSGGTLQFDGADDYVQLPNLGSLSSFTISCWFCSTGNGSTGDGNYNTIIGSGNRNRLLYKKNNLLAQIGKDNDNHYAGINLEHGEWGYITYTYDATTQKATWFFNATKINEKQGDAFLHATALRLGAYDLVNYMHKGFMREIVIYNRALSFAEITQNYLATKTPMPLEHVDGAVLDLRGTEGTNGPPPTTVWQDSSSHGNHATLKNVDFSAGDGWTGAGLEFDGVVVTRK